MQLSFEIKDNTGEVKKILEEKGSAIMDAIGAHLTGEAQDELENDPRRVDTGNLKNSITHIEPDNFTTIVGTNVDYAIYVHEGTRKMAPNRFLKNAVERNTGQIMSYIERGLSS